MKTYLPILVLLTITIALPIIIWNISSLIRPHSPNAIKNSAYECGINIESKIKSKFSIRYYLIAVIFLIFDVETLFLVPWAIQVRNLAKFGLIEICIFMFFLLMGYGYVWSKGALTWE